MIFNSLRKKNDIIRARGDQMKFRLIIDPSREEEIVATVREKTELIERIERLALGREDGFMVTNGEASRMLTFSETECISTIGGKTYAIASDGEKYRLKMRLYEVEAMLPSEFFRINKSAIANKERLERFTVSFSGAVDAIFKSGYREYVSRRCFAEIKRRFGIK